MGVDYVEAADVAARLCAGDFFFAGGGGDGGSFQAQRRGGGGLGPTAAARRWSRARLARGDAPGCSRSGSSTSPRPPRRAPDADDSAAGGSQRRARDADGRARRRAAVQLRARRRRRGVAALQRFVAEGPRLDSGVEPIYERVLRRRRR